MCYSRANHPYNRGRHHDHRQHAKRWWKNKLAQSWGYPPVNVEEFDNRYEILLYAAGYAKDEFNISLKDNTLLVVVDKPDTASSKDFKWHRHTYQPRGFERYFELNEKIDKEAINAQYADGVLKITLPKLSDFETVRKEIEVE